MQYFQASIAVFLETRFLLENAAKLRRVPGTRGVQPQAMDFSSRFASSTDADDEASYREAKGRFEIL
jgi:hypothetical protein